MVPSANDDWGNRIIPTCGKNEMKKSTQKLLEKNRGGGSLAGNLLCRTGWLQNHTDPPVSAPRRDQSMGHPTRLAMIYPSHQKFTPQKPREKTPQQQQRVNHMIKRPVGWGDICKSDLLRVNSQHLNQAPMTNRKKISHRF